MSEDHCPDCGALVEGGREGCQQLMDTLNVQAFGDAGLGRSRDLAFDTYCMQHLEKYCLSAKSYAAHLTRLCCGLEYNRNPAVYGALQKWLNGNVSLQKPPILPSLGNLTIQHVFAAQTLEEYPDRIQAWAKAVWTAYASQHDLARQWVKAALAAQKLPIAPTAPTAPTRP